MNNLSKIENYPNYLKDMKSKAVLNNNYSAFEEFKEKILIKDKIHSLTNDYKDLKHDINEIKETLNILLKSLLNK